LAADSLIWQTAVEKIVTPIASSLLKMISTRIKRRIARAYHVEELSDCLSSGKIHFGDTIRVHGTFSEYIPFVDLTRLLPLKVKNEKNQNKVATCGLGDIVKTGEYVAVLFEDQATQSTGPSIPILYSSKRNKEVFSLSTGQQVEFLCAPVPLDYGFRSILHRNEYFTFDNKPFGLRVMNVCTKRPEMVDEFRIDAFLLKSLVTQGPIDELYDSFSDLGEVLYQGGFGLASIACALTCLHRSELIRLHKRDHAGTVTVDWLGPLIRFSTPVDILSNAPRKTLARLLQSSPFDESYEVLGEMYALNDLCNRKMQVDQIVRGEELKKPLVKRFVRKLRSRDDLAAAIDMYLNPQTAVDFQFDQVTVSQTIDVRKILSDRGYVV
jgi:hypothetical protein